MSDRLSKTQVRKAGDVVRAVRPAIYEEADSLVGFSIETFDDFEPSVVIDAITTVQRYRDGHSDAQRAVHRALGEAFRAEGFFVSSRQKRLQAIADKLQRIESIRLPQMADLAGCRIVVAGLPSIITVRERLEADFDVVDVDDYIAKPKAIGYRAMHVVIKLPDSNPFMAEGVRDTLVEVQVRTPRQNEWADQVERAAGTTGLDLKGGDVTGLPRELVEYLQVASEIRWLADIGDPADIELESRLDDLRESVRKYF